MSGFRKIAAKFAAPLKLGLWQALSWFYDNVIWISVELYFGFTGVIGLVVIAMSLNLGALLYYRHKKVSWLCWDTATNEIKNNPWKNYLRTVFFLGILFWENFFGIVFIIIFVGITFLVLTKIILKVRVLESIFMFFLLSIYQDAFICTTYLRYGHADGFGKRDWLIFVTSSIVSIGYWVIRNGIIAEFIIRPMLKM